MDELQLWAQGLMTLGLGPDQEWHPACPGEHQWFHAQFWSLVERLLPEDEDDEPFWMTQAAAIKLLKN